MGVEDRARFGHGERADELPIHAGWTWPLLLPGKALVGIGVGLANPALGLAAIGSVEGDLAGARALGGSAGDVVQLYQSVQTSGVRVALLVAIAMAAAGAGATAWHMRRAPARPTPGAAPASVPDV